MTFFPVFETIAHILPVIYYVKVKEPLLHSHPNEEVLDQCWGFGVLNLQKPSVVFTAEPTEVTES